MYRCVSHLCKTVHEQICLCISLCTHLRPPVAYTNVVSAIKVVATVCHWGNNDKGGGGRVHMASGEALGALESFPSSIVWIHRCRTRLWRDDRISVSQKRKQNLDRLRAEVTGNLRFQLRHRSLFILPPWHETHKSSLLKPKAEPCSKFSSPRKISGSLCS